MTQTNSMTKLEKEIWLHRAFVKMERRHLVVLLEGEAKELYLDFLMKPQAYRDYIRGLEMIDEPEKR
jgi:hypothetical protein